jgi:hypothetical protein
MMAFAQPLNTLASLYTLMANWYFLLPEIFNRRNVDNGRVEDCGNI